MAAKNIENLIMYNLRGAVLLMLLGVMCSCDQRGMARTVGGGEQPVAPLAFLEKTVVAFDGTTRQRFVNNRNLFTEGWDTLAQTRFWQQIITLSHDSMIMNIAGIRKPLYMLATDDWHCQSDSEKDAYKRNLCCYLDLDSNTSIYVTTGKKFFFEHRKVVPMISRAIPVFENDGTDPWFAQTILLIESPGKSEARSSVGARGPFQLMPSVARKFGLVVNKYHDDRTSLEKSALAASRLIRTICIPNARRILDSKGITYHETDTWFRLFVMHIYHAGATNVEAVVDRINPAEGGMSLIRSMWVNEARGFKNESQNYSQIALASLVQFDNMIAQDNDTVYLVSGDRSLRAYFGKSVICVDTLSYLESCLNDFESDLVEGTIPMEYFASKTTQVRLEIDKWYGRHGNKPIETAYRESLRLHNLGTELMYKRKYNEAIYVFKMGLERNPTSPATYDSLGRAYRQIGNMELAEQCAKKSKALFDQNQSQNNP